MIETGNTLTHTRVCVCVCSMAQQPPVGQGLPIIEAS
jgi:hypothetical protein